MSYAKRVAAETETEETAQYPQEKDRTKQTMSKSKSKKGRQEKRRKKKRQHRQRKKEGSSQGECSYFFRLARSAVPNNGPAYRKRPKIAVKIYTWYLVPDTWCLVPRIGISHHPTEVTRSTSTSAAVAVPGTSAVVLQQKTEHVLRGQSTTVVLRSSYKRVHG